MSVSTETDLPEPVPPTTRTVALSEMSHATSAARSAGMDPMSTRSARVRFTSGNRLMVSRGPLGAMSWCTAFTRLPSWRRPSASGSLTSSLRLRGARIFWQISRRCSLFRKRAPLTRISRPRRSA